MYITSDLFGGNTAYNHRDTVNSPYWAAMADPTHTAGLGKRKRLEGEDGHSATCPHQQRLSSPSRRSQAGSTSPSEGHRHLPFSVYSASPLFNTSERRPVKQMKRLSPKATLVKSTSHLMDIEPDLPPALSKVDAHAHPTSDLRPCHVCKSAPKRKKDLENYLDCRRCEGRTCYICARQCFGGCGKAVCKKCIVEVGEEGDPWCLDCYARNINS